MTESPLPTKVLYYPYINFRNVDWLKASLLYWEGINRIVPSYHPDDSIEVIELAQAGLVSNIHPESFREAAELRFNNHIKQFLPELKRNLKQNSRVQDDMHLGMVTGAGDFIHLDKISANLVNRFRRENLAQVSGDWMYTEKHVSSFYMTCLAIEIGSSMKTPLSTDSQRHIRNGSKAWYRPISIHVATPHTLMLNLKLDFPTPGSMAKISIDDILIFRNRYSSERIRFRAAIESIRLQASQIDNQTALADYLNEQSNEIMSARKDYVQSLSAKGVEFAHELLNISMPTAFVNIAANILAPTLATAITSVGLALGVVRWYAKAREEERQLNRTNPWYYLVPLNKKFSSRHKQLTLNI